MLHFSTIFFQDVAVFYELKFPDPQVGQSHHCGQRGVGMIIIWPSLVGEVSCVSASLGEDSFIFSAVLFEHEMARNPEDPKSVWEIKNQN